MAAPIHPLIGEVYAGAGSRLLASAISPEEGAFLHRLVGRSNAAHSIEIGCAFGLSSLHICLALQGRPNASHTILDPFQTSTFDRAGVRLLERAGIDFFHIIEERSELELPKLLESGRQFDFCFIDGLHTFDQTLLDFYYLNRMLKVGGILAIDDINHPAVNKAAKYIITYPCYRLIGTAGSRGRQRKALNAAKAVCSAVLAPFSRLAGESTAHEFFDTTLVRPHVRRALDTCTLAAFEKTTEDGQRDTNWFRNL
jgi:predicted O-methyltransferase YrrM